MGLTNYPRGQALWLFIVKSQIRKADQLIGMELGDMMQQRSKLLFLFFYFYYLTANFWEKIMVWLLLIVFNVRLNPNLIMYCTDEMVFTPVVAHYSEGWPAMVKYILKHPICIALNVLVLINLTDSWIPKLLYSCETEWNGRYGLWSRTMEHSAWKRIVALGRWINGSIKSVHSDRWGYRGSWQKWNMAVCQTPWSQCPPFYIWEFA